MASCAHHALLLLDSHLLWQALEANSATSVGLVLEHSLLISGTAYIGHVDEVDVLLVLCLFGLDRLEISHMLQVVVMVRDHFTSDMAKLALSWVHHHHIHRIPIDLLLLHAILVIAMSISLIGIHLVPIELLWLHLGHVYFRVRVLLLDHPDILSV